MKRKHQHSLFNGQFKEKDEIDEGKSDTSSWVLQPIMFCLCIQFKMTILLCKSFPTKEDRGERDEFERRQIYRWVGRHFGFPFKRTDWFATNKTIEHLLSSTIEWVYRCRWWSIANGCELKEPDVISHSKCNRWLLMNLIFETPLLPARCVIFKPNKEIVDFVRCELICTLNIVLTSSDDTMVWCAVVPFTTTAASSGCGQQA